MIPKTLSASSLQVFALCPDRWATEYMDRAKGLDNDAAKVGTSVHGAFEMWVQAVHIDKTHAHLDRVKQKELLITFYQMSYVQTFATADMDTEEYKDGFNLCMNWFKRTSFQGVMVESVELKETIMVPYNDPADPTADTALAFNYIMDRVDQVDETTWQVVDYKSQRVPISLDELEVKIQARAYALAIQIKHPECQKVIVTMDLLRHNPVSITFTRDDNIAFWKFLCEETQRIVNLAREDVKPKLNLECGYCPKKYTCPLLQGNIDVGGYHSLSIDEKAILMARLEDQIKANKRIVDEMQEALQRHAYETDSLQWDTADGAFEVEIGLTRAARQFPANRAAEIMGPELFATMGNMTLGNLEKIIKDQSLPQDMREQLSDLITPGNGNPKAFVKPKKKLI